MILRLMIACCFFVSHAQAANIEIAQYRGRDAIAISGEIEPGDALRFASVYRDAPLFPHGYTVITLDSLGGSVSEALLISELMRGRNFHTVIPDGSRCASACASIIFLSGSLRTVDLFGALGQHSCSSGGVADQECNELIAEYAMSHGVSHGSVSAFVTRVPPEDILWFSREDADGWGLTRYYGEREGGFEKSEPRVLEALLGRHPVAQSVWRVDFFGDGYRAFLRPWRDDSSELEMNVFCFEDQRGELRVTIQTLGDASVVEGFVQFMSVRGPEFSHVNSSPMLWQNADYATIETSFSQGDVISFFKADEVEVIVGLAAPYAPLGGRSFMKGSRKNVAFAANHCASTRSVVEKAG